MNKGASAPVWRDFPRTWLRCGGGVSGLCRADLHSATWVTLIERLLSAAPQRSRDGKIIKGIESASSPEAPVIGFFGVVQEESRYERDCKPTGTTTLNLQSERREGKSFKNKSENTLKMRLSEDDRWLIRLRHHAGVPG